ncbi:SPOR domain-containing protein [Luteimonas sp. WGS1318]|uniref:SPOR domain-containing protein n=1 Tax=Luteimonas sp. WGS1318 TaxID=3366815 RepID=UPI00372D27C6
MWLRALVVLLVILNFGVAAWWAVRGDAGDAHALAALDRGTLLLASEPLPEQAPVAPADTASVDVAPSPSPAPPMPEVDAAPSGAGNPPQCVALGPFADGEMRDAARARLADVAVRTAAREVGETPRGWRVWMAPLADRAAADAVVARLLGAGFTDYYVIGDGPEANGVALGRFGSEAPAQGRAAALREAGFDAEAQPLGSVLVRYWIDAMAVEGVSAQTLRAHAASARAESRDCNVAWDAG